MPLDYVVVAVAAIGAAMTAAPALFGRWSRPGLRRWSLAASAVMVVIAGVAVFGWIGPGHSAPLSYSLLALSVALTVAGMVVLYRDERRSGDTADDSPRVSPGTGETASHAAMGTAGPEGTPGTGVGRRLLAGAEPDPSPGGGAQDEAAQGGTDLSEEARLFSTTTRHGWAADLAELLAADEDETPAAPPRRGA